MTLDMTGYERAGHRIMKLRARKTPLTLSRRARQSLADLLGEMLIPGIDSAVAASDILEIIDGLAGDAGVHEPRVPSPPRGEMRAAV